MTSSGRARYRPRLNHVAITMDPAAARRRTVAPRSSTSTATCSAGPRATTPASAGNPLILYTGAFGEFVYLLAGGRPSTAPPIDHFGLQVATLERAPGDRRPGEGRARRATTGCEVIDVARAHHARPDDDYTLTSAYIGFVLPLSIELQHIARKS